MAYQERVLIVESDAFSQAQLTSSDGSVLFEKKIVDNILICDITVNPEKFIHTAALAFQGTVDGDIFEGIQITAPVNSMLLFEWETGQFEQKIQTSATTTYMHTYGSGGDKTLKIFAAGVTALILRTDGGAANTYLGIAALPSSLTSLDFAANLVETLPALPSGLITLICAANPLGTLPALPASLQTLECNVSQLTELPALPNSLVTLVSDGNLLVTLPAMAEGGLTIGLSGNQITVAAVNACLVQLDSYDTEDGTVDLSGQSPPATPTGAGAAAVTALEGKGWTVFVD